MDVHAITSGSSSEKPRITGLSSSSVKKNKTKKVRTLPSFSDTTSSHISSLVFKIRKSFKIRNNKLTQAVGRARESGLSPSRVVVTVGELREAVRKSSVPYDEIRQHYTKRHKDQADRYRDGQYVRRVYHHGKLQFCRIYRKEIKQFIFKREGNKYIDFTQKKDYTVPKDLPDIRVLQGSLNEL